MRTWDGGDNATRMPYFDHIDWPDKEAVVSFIRMCAFGGVSGHSSSRKKSNTHSLQNLANQHKCLVVSIDSAGAATSSLSRGRCPAAVLPSKQLYLKTYHFGGRRETDEGNDGNYSGLPGPEKSREGHLPKSLKPFRAEILHFYV